jgi:hypothetical protein
MMNRERAREISLCYRQIEEVEKIIERLNKSDVIKFRDKENKALQQFDETDDNFQAIKEFAIKCMKTELMILEDRLRKFDMPSDAFKK